MKDKELVTGCRDSQECAGQVANSDRTAVRDIMQTIE
jgi:hypothetical protein